MGGRGCVIASRSAEATHVSALTLRPTAPWCVATEAGVTDFGYKELRDKALHLCSQNSCCNIQAILLFLDG